MHITGIVCEYNPLHLGHKKQMDMVRGMLGADTAIVCILSGNFVQRGHPAIFDKMRRAQAALECGADLVLELPVTYALSSAEGFAAGSVRFLSPICHSLCFGAENPEKEALLGIAQALLSPEFPILLKAQLATGKSFPAARQAALEAMGLEGSLAASPNNILAIEYCKAILAQGSAMEPLPIYRAGSYHDENIDRENPSATALRRAIEGGQDISAYAPVSFAGTPVHTLAKGEKAMLAKLRTMTEAEFEALPYGGEGLWRKFMRNCRSEAALEAILEATKSKRYTRSRLDRMAMCGFLGLTEEDLTAPAPYARVLALNERGRSILRQARETLWLPNIGDKIDHPYQEIENRCDALYGLFADFPEPPEPKYRICAAALLPPPLGEVAQRSCDGEGL